MVLETNIPFHIVSKYVQSFIEELQVDASIREQISIAWKDKGNLSKLKSKLKKTAGPKRVMSKYLYFCRDERPKIIAENPGMNIKDVTCELGRRWKEWQQNPDPERQQKIQQLFDEDKKRYDEAKHQVKKAPKRPAPKSPYLAFCAAERVLTPKISMKELGIKWNLVKQQPEEFEKYKALVLNVS